MSGGALRGHQWRGRCAEGPKRGLEPLSDVVARVMRQTSGKRARTEDQVGAAWRQVVSDRVWVHTRPAGLRRGVLTLEVDNSALLQELAAFQKDLLLQALRPLIQGVYIQDLRFRLGPARAIEA